MTTASEAYTSSGGRAGCIPGREDREDTTAGPSQHCAYKRIVRGTTKQDNGRTKVSPNTSVVHGSLSHRDRHAGSAHHCLNFPRSSRNNKTRQRKNKGLAKYLCCSWVTESPTATLGLRITVSTRGQRLALPHSSRLSTAAYTDRATTTTQALPGPGLQGGSRNERTTRNINMDARTVHIVPRRRHFRQRSKDDGVLVTVAIVMTSTGDLLLHLHDDTRGPTTSTRSSSQTKRTIQMPAPDTSTKWRHHDFHYRRSCHVLHLVKRITLQGRVRKPVAEEPHSHMPQKQQPCCYGENLKTSCGAIHTFCQQQKGVVMRSLCKKIVPTSKSTQKAAKEIKTLSNTTAPSRGSSKGSNVFKQVPKLTVLGHLNEPKDHGETSKQQRQRPYKIVDLPKGTLQQLTAEFVPPVQRIRGGARFE
ncbi:unnamed protein product [Cyprideis torosa]|uniref:Uncharacterized protein n=1 Tax=Cyprideis torosa TaxID=163714 RepID=A0A7R8W441_9CRUS|nr:unnamed protein product [Cyprideis torosa]CAG0882766.1 unnamed protein product [Cyprideis torosa]